MVFQSYALYPHLTVAENIAYPLKVRKVPAAQRAAAVRRVADSLEVDVVHRAGPVGVDLADVFERDCRQIRPPFAARAIPGAARSNRIG